MRRALIAAAILLVGLGLHASHSRGVATVPVGLDLEFVEGSHAPLPVIAGETYYLDSITIRTGVHGRENNILRRLRTQSDFRDLDWDGLELERYEWLPNQDGSFELEQFHHRAGWMGGEQRFTLSVKDASGNLLSPPVEIESTPDWPARATEAFATRRFAALVFGHGVVDKDDTGNVDYSAEGWMQLRNGVPDNRTFVIPPNADRLEVEWSRMPGRIFEVALEPEAAPAWSYGFDIQVEPSTSANGAFFQPGETVEFRVTFTDGEGNRLHPPGSLPTYGEFLMGQVPSGLRYYDFFPAIVFYRDKNREGVLLASFTGPEDRVRQTHEAVPLASFLQDQVHVAAFRDRDGFSSQWRMIPPSPIVFGGEPGWSTPVSDSLTFQLPADALAGSYEFVIKARRLFRGEESLATASVNVRVGDTSATIVEAAEPLVRKCEDCHTGIFDLSRMLHYNGDVDSCTPCHLPLEFETNNLLPHRIHRIHDLSERYTEPRDSCTVCHLNPTREVEDNARWLVCTGCHNPWETHEHLNFAGDLDSCADFFCHHTISLHIHDLGQSPRADDPLPFSEMELR